MNTREYKGWLNRVGEIKEVNDHLTLEHPLTVRINGEAFTLTMHTPGDELDLIRGLLFSEGIYKKREGKLRANILKRSPENFISDIDINLDDSELDKSLLNKRNLLSVASCGICGKTELPVLEGQKLMENASVEDHPFDSMFKEMLAHQNAFDKSGGCHAASIFNKNHQLMGVREDIGRHNAVDKVIGHLLNEGSLKEAKYLLVSGRVSYEIITKCFTAGIPVLAAVSAPSSLAVDFSKELGIQLYGFVREGRWTKYA